jgi:hypothetical protein
MGSFAALKMTDRKIGRAALFTLLAIIPFLPSCRIAAPTPASSPAVLGPDALVPSPRLIIGRVIAVEMPQGFAFVELATDAPATALVDGTELITRTLDLRETARLRVSRYVRGRTLGTKVVAGQPSPGDEVVWLAP